MKKTSLILVSMLVIATILAGCGAKTTDNKANTPSDSTANKSTDSATTEPAKSAKEQVSTNEGPKSSNKDTQSTNKGNVSSKKVKLSEMAPPNSIKAYFYAGKDGRIVAKSESKLEAKVGQTIAFIPSNEETKKAFDEEKILLFTDYSIQQLNTSRADMIKEANFYKFDIPGEYHFLLSSTFEENEPPTFTISVK